MLGSLAAAASQFTEPLNLVLIFAGVSGGMLIGGLPGLTGTMAIALLVPFTHGMASTASLMLLGGVYIGAMFGGSIPAILVNVPGTPSAIATTFDGYPMTRNGRAMDALVASVTSSSIGGLIGVIALLFLSPPLAALALQFGPPEYFWLGILGITIIGSLTSGSVTKGLVGGALGILLSTVGYARFGGVPRFTFGTSALLSGVNLVVALIGLFSIPEVLELAENRRSATTLGQYKTKSQTIIRIIRRVVTAPYLIARSTIIGVLVGILPGAGGNVAGLVSYKEAVRASRTPEKFGTGAVDGVIASQTASNAEIGGSLVPLLTLGIPGAPQAAVLLGALLLHGLRPGPQLYSGHDAVITYAFILSLFIANLMMFVVGLYGARLYANLLRIPIRFLVPVIVLLSTVGAYAIRNNAVDILVMFTLGVGAYVLKKLGIHPGTIALGIILGPIIETGLVETLQVAQAEGGVLDVFFTRPISIVLIILSVLSAGWPLIARSLSSVAPTNAHRSNGKD